jgi:ribonuclease HI
LIYLAYAIEVNRLFNLYCAFRMPTTTRTLRILSLAHPHAGTYQPVLAWQVHFDGAARGNHRRSGRSAGWGFQAIRTAMPSDPPIEHCGFLGDVSNNLAEFTAFVASCQFLADVKASSARIHGDSRLVVEAWEGKVRLKDPDLRTLLAEARLYLACIGPHEVVHVPRSLNRAADAIANRAVDLSYTSLTLRPALTWIAASCPDPTAPTATPPDSFPAPLLSRPLLAPVLAGLAQPSAADIPFPEASTFVAGALHSHVPEWSAIISATPRGHDVLRWLRDGVDATEFFQHFRGSFMGRTYDSATPPPAVFRNHTFSPHLESFIDDKIREEVRVGAAVVWGTVGECDPPHLAGPTYRMRAI